MIDDLEPTTLHVEDPGEPPPEALDPLTDDVEPSLDGEVTEPVDRTAAADSVAFLLRAGFHVTGLGLSRRLAPGARRDQVVELWGVSDVEARPVAEAIAAALPERWLRSRVLAHSPAVAAVVELGALIQARAVATADIYQEESDDTATEPAPESAATGARSSRPSAARGAAHREEPVPGGLGEDGHTSAGLGLEQPVQPGPVRVRQRRGAQPAS